MHASYRRESGEILLGVSTSSMKEKIIRTIFDLLSLKIWLRGHAHGGVKFFKLCDRMSRRNRNRVRKHISLFIRGIVGSES